MSEQSHVSVRQTIPGIDGLLAEQRQTSSSNLGTMLRQLKCIIDILFELRPNIWPVGLIGLKKTQNLSLDLSGLLHVLLNRPTRSSLSANLSNGLSFQLLCNCTCSHSLSNIERTSSSPLSTNHRLI